MIHTIYDIYSVFHKGKVSHYVNQFLLLKQKAEHNLEKIIALHVTRLDIEEAIKATDDQTLLRGYVKDLTLCEFELQKLWNFPEDARFHRFWLTPKCLCPKMDNEENYGTGRVVIRQDCPLHGPEHINVIELTGIK